MSLNFNVSPYYDDFDPTKNYHRILFKPGAAVQARELTQSQTILQNQISNFADHIFTQNTPVKGAKVTLNLDCHYVKLNPQFNNTNIVAADFLNKIITDESNTILARVIATAESTGTASVAGDPPTLIVSYISGLHFTDGIQIYDSEGSNIAATTVGTPGGTTCTGFASVASISTGIFYIVNGYSQSQTVNEDGTYTKYAIGNFVQVNPHTIILNKYDNTPTYRVGLEISESIIDYIDDPSLLDEAVGASNYQAPGADRYKIELNLTKLPLTVGSDSQFIELLRTNSGQITKQVDNTVYSTIDDYFAKRDYESNGDYIVNDFKLTTSANTTNSAKYDINIGPGVAYVNGYRIENRGPIIVTNDRARSTASANNNNIYVDYGNYFYVDTVKGSFDVTKMAVVHLHSVPSVGISANINGVSANSNTYNSTLVGTARIRNIDYVTDNGSSNTRSYVFQAYLTDINTNVLSGTANSIASTSNTLKVNTASAGIFSTTANAYVGMTLSITAGTSIGDKRIVSSYDNTSKTFTVSQPFSAVPDGTTTFSMLMSTSDVESIVIPDGSASFSANANINILSRVDGLPSGYAELKSPGGQELVFNVGNPYVASLANTEYTTTRIWRNQSFSSSTGLQINLGSDPFRFQGTGVLSSDTIKENYLVANTSTGQILDFATSGNTVTVTGGTQVSFTSGTYPTGAVDVIAKVGVTSADNGSDNGLVLKSKSLIEGNTSVVGTLSAISSSNTKIDLTKGQVLIANEDSKSASMSLFTCDVKRILKVIDTGSPSTDPTNAMLSNSAYDVTDRYKLNNGQKDSYYDHATISPIPGANLAKGKLFIVFDYYSHSGGDGVFDVLSYLGAGDGGVSASPENYGEIPSYTATSGTTYQLRDCVDFRPTRKNAQVAFEFNLHNTTVATAGFFIPVNLTNFQNRYSYYLGRKDLLVLSRDKSFEIIQGTSTSNPIYPSQPDGAMVIANLAHDPYTVYVPGENSSDPSTNLSVDKIVHKRWTKSDITDLQTRVNDLEYYTSLSLLEQKAQSLQVPDENGLNRFKNGILVDNFSSYSVVDTINKDFSCNINIRQGKMMPLTPILNYQLQNPQVLSSLGTLANNTSFHISSINGGATNIFTLPYTSANVVVQQLASGTVSVNPFNVTIQQGAAALSPPMDNWVDTAQAPSVYKIGPETSVSQQTTGINMTNCGDFATIPGTSITSGATTQTTNSGVASSLYATNGYVQNVSILPYIRPQQLGFRTKGLLVNTPVSVWFDGQNINQYITTPDTIELTSVSGTFKEDDIVGFLVSSVFTPVARVLGVYKYPTGNKVRLYVSMIPDVPLYTGTTTLQNGKYDNGGFYISGSSTASGTLSSGGQSINTSGTVRGVGDMTIDGAGSSITIYKMNYNNGGWNSFLNQYGVWGDTVGSSSFSYSPTFIPDVAGNYTFTCSSTGSSVSVVANTGTSIYTAGTVSPTTTNSKTVTITSGQLNKPFTVNITVTGSAIATYGLCAFALTVTDPNGNMVLNTVNPPEVVYNATDIYEDMPYGGRYFSGVQEIQLGENASANTNYYVGCTINITSKFVYDFVQQTATYHPTRYVAATVPDGDNAYWAPAYITYDVR